MHDKYPTAEGVGLRFLIRIPALSHGLPSSHAWVKEPVRYMAAVTEEVSAVGMHVDLCFVSGCMHVLRHGVLMLLGILKVFQI
jgi:hypothetical protein